MYYFRCICSKCSFIHGMEWNGLSAWSDRIDDHLLIDESVDRTDRQCCSPTNPHPSRSTKNRKKLNLPKLKLLSHLHYLISDMNPTNKFNLLKKLKPITNRWWYALQTLDIEPSLRERRRYLYSVAIVRIHGKTHSTIQFYVTCPSLRKKTKLRYWQKREPILGKVYFTIIISIKNIRCYVASLVFADFRVGKAANIQRGCSAMANPKRKHSYYCPWKEV